jgi:hypothetical protein
VHDRLPLEYAATRARRAISLKAVRHSNDDLWSFIMLPYAPPVSVGSPPFSFIPLRHAIVAVTFHSSQQRVVMNAARSDPSTPRARACTCAAQRREQERAMRKKERRIRRRERREKRDEDSSYASSRDSLPRRPRSTRRREREKRKKVTGGRPP